jgi:murein L,D-transpeptidase YcbB/YkuD
MSLQGVVMVYRPLSVIAATMALLIALITQAGPGWSQGKPKKAQAAMGLDADGEGPDPLAPSEGPRRAPAAPGTPVRSAEQKPAAEPDAIVALVRQRLTSEPARGSAGDREDYAALAAFYTEGDGQPVWTTSGGLTPRAALAIGELRKADDWGLRAGEFIVPALDGAATTETLADAEIKLGQAVLKYGRYARGGRLDPRAVSRLFDQQPAVYDPKTLIQAIAAADAPDAYLRRLHPQHVQFERLRQAMLAARGARPEVNPAHVRIPAGPQIKPGQAHDHVALLRQRLGVPAPADGKGDSHDDALVAAVKAFQQQSGLKPTGAITTATRNALNEALRPSGAESVRRLVVNMERWRWMPEDLGAFYVWDSVPEQMTAVYDQGKQVLSEKIVVGKPNTPTPMFSANMLFVIFHPSWGVPPGMKANELLPQLRNASGGFFNWGGASSVLASHGLRVTRGGQPVDPNSVNWASADIGSYEFVQPPGPSNVLGIVKFRFPNKHNVYMHDTPERHLFGGAVRAFSHGCMRVQNPVRLAEVLLAHDKGWSTDAVQSYVKRGGEIKLSTPIPVHITYFTTVVDDDGKVRNFADLYGMDNRTAQALDGPAAATVTGSVTTSDAGGTKATRAKSRVKKSKPPQTLFESLFGN